MKLKRIFQGVQTDLAKVVNWALDIEEARHA